MTISSPFRHVKTSPDIIRLAELPYVRYRLCQSKTGLGRAGRRPNLA